MALFSLPLYLVTRFIFLFSPTFVLGGYTLRDWHRAETGLASALNALSWLSVGFVLFFALR